MAIVSVVKYDGTPDVFAWKYPDDELGTWTQLIVNESQQAILFKGGQALDVFEAGRHTLDTYNIPFLEKIVNLPFGGDSPFKAEIWFVNKAFNLDVKWGTPSPIQIQDSKYNVLLPVRSNGVFGLRIVDPKKFLVKLVGTLPSFRKEDIANYFRGLYVARVKDAISTYILEEKVSVLEVNMYLDELSEFLQQQISPVMDEYGIGLVNFFVNSISVPENDPAVVKLRESLSRRAEMDIVGFNYVQERSFDTLEGAATNQGSMVAPLMGAGMGMGMGFGMGAGMGGAFAELAQNLSIAEVVPGKGNEAGAACAHCGSLIPSGYRFCGACGKEASASTATAIKFCGMCGNEIVPGNRFCSQCGTEAPHLADKPAPKDA